MWDFIRGWRRKTGMLTLLIACMFMGMWVRSRSLEDSLSLPTGNVPSGGKPPMGWYVSSSNGYLVAYSAQSGTEAYWPFPDYITTPVVDGSFTPSDGSIEIQFHWLGLGAGKSEAVSGVDPNPEELLYTSQIWFVSYWTIITPLTLFSAYLLLTKPRKPIQEKTTELIANIES